MTDGRKKATEHKDQGQCFTMNPDRTDVREEASGATGMHKGQRL
jgi:hypothetical protein